MRIKRLIGYYRYWKSYFVFKKQLAASGRHLSIRRLPIVHEFSTTHGFDRHYVYHPAWAARILAKTRPKKHIDIASTLHFSTIISAYIPTEFYDFRKVLLSLDNLQTGRADLTTLAFPNNSISSLSCMHTVEHIGLGRYGDSVNVHGDTQAMRELERVLTPGGNLLFVVPVGKPAVIFNAHRIYSFEDIIGNFPSLELVEFALVPDNVKEGLIIGASPEFVSQQSYGCGCFWFKKKNIL